MISRLNRLLPRLLSYWILSACAAGIVAVLARFPVYSGGAGSFVETFLLCSIPIPMALGMFHLPAQLAGSVVCIWRGRPFFRSITKALAVVFLLALLAHAVAGTSGYQDHWWFFAFATVDVGILLIIGLLLVRSTRDSVS